MKKARSEPPVATAPGEAISSELRAALEAAAAMPDDEIDTSDPDAPEVLDWTDAVRGHFYKPRKVQKTLRIDADVLAYYEAEGPGYLSRMNRDLRAAMTHSLLQRRRKAARKGSPTPEKRGQRLS